MMQAFAFNIRRAKFRDPRVRLAFNYAFDFEGMNKQIFFGQYKRIASYFEGTDLASSGLPSGRELELLNTVREQIPGEVFKKSYSNPVSGNPTAVRDNLREATRLFKEAGYEVRDQRLVDGKTGEPFTVEFLGNDPTFERVFLIYKPSLERLGMTVSVRTVDEAQYESRLSTWDFDITTFGWRTTQLPGNGLRDYWGSRAADELGTDNVVGIKNTAVDAMIDRVIFANSYDELVAAARALDRILLWHYYVVPQWSYNKQRTARWDRFGHPDPLPQYGISDSRRCGGGMPTKRPRSERIRNLGSRILFRDYLLRGRTDVGALDRAGAEQPRRVFELFEEDQTDAAGHGASGECGDRKSNDRASGNGKSERRSRRCADTSGYRAPHQSDDGGARPLTLERHAIELAQLSHHPHDDGGHAGDIHDRQRKEPAHGRIGFVSLHDFSRETAPPFRVVTRMHRRHHWPLAAGRERPSGSGFIPAA